VYNIVQPLLTCAVKSVLVPGLALKLCMLGNEWQVLYR